MGTDINGYVEINTIRESDESIWFEIVKIDVIAERNYEIFGNLFGVRAAAGVKAIAASRGIPDATSNPNSLTCNFNTYVGHSWATWLELKLARELIISNSESSGWTFLFECMESLSKLYGEQNVRLVVAFDNYG